MNWTTTTTDRFVRINGVWLRAGAVNAVERKNSGLGKSRVHLDGTTVDVPLNPDQTADTIINAITQEDTP